METVLQHHRVDNKSVSNSTLACKKVVSQGFELLIPLDRTQKSASFDTIHNNVRPRFSSLNGIKRRKVLLFLAIFVKEGRMSDLRLSSALSAVLYMRR